MPLCKPAIFVFSTTSYSNNPGGADISRRAGGFIFCFTYTIEGQVFTRGQRAGSCIILSFFCAEMSLCCGGEKKKMKTSHVHYWWWELKSKHFILIAPVTGMEQTNKKKQVELENWFCFKRFKCIESNRIELFCFRHPYRIVFYWEA